MGKKILVIDDSDQDRKIVKKYLSREGFEETFLVETGEEGIQQVKVNAPDIVVTDTNLPGIDGFETCRKIKDIAPAAKVIIMTGHVDAVDAGKAREMGADDYCVKTSDYAVLINAVKNLTAE